MLRRVLVLESKHRIRWVDQLKHNKVLDSFRHLNGFFRRQVESPTSSSLASAVLLCGLHRCVRITAHSGSFFHEVNALQTVRDTVASGSVHGSILALGSSGSQIHVGFTALLLLDPPLIRLAL